MLRTRELATHKEQHTNTPTGSQNQVVSPENIHALCGMNWFYL